MIALNKARRGVQGRLVGVSRGEEGRGEDEATLGQDVSCANGCGERDSGCDTECRCERGSRKTRRSGRDLFVVREPNQSISFPLIRA